MTKSCYIHGPKFKELLKISNLKLSNYIVDAPYTAKLQNDSVYMHSRNSNIKDQIFYDAIKNNEVKTYCLRPFNDADDNKKGVSCPKIQISSRVSQSDVWLHFVKNEKSN